MTYKKTDVQEYKEHGGLHMIQEFRGQVFPDVYNQQQKRKDGL